MKVGNLNCPDILKKIVATKKQEIEATGKKLNDFKSILKNIPPALNFQAVLGKPGLAVIAEIKKASPSAGIIDEQFNYCEIAEAYNAGGADAISVLTDKDYFKGDIEYIRQIRDIVQIPILRKDFIIDPSQIYEARAYGADSFLLISAILTINEMKEFINLGRSLGMEPLIESHNLQDLEKTIAAGANIIGINNRNLFNFSVDFNTSEKLFPLIPTTAISVSESGIYTSEQTRHLGNVGFNAVLIGESLMKAGLHSSGQAIKKFKS